MYGFKPKGITVATHVSGLKIIVDGVAYTAPQRFDWKAGTWHSVEVPSEQTLDGAAYEFGRWNDDGQSAHTIAEYADLTEYLRILSQRKLRVTNEVNIGGNGAARTSEVVISEARNNESRRDWRRQARSALKLSSPDTLPLRRIEAIGDSVPECIGQLEARGLDRMRFEFTRLVPPY